MGIDPPESEPAADAPLTAGRTARRGQTIGNCGAQSHGDYGTSNGYPFEVCGMPQTSSVMSARLLENWI